VSCCVSAAAALLTLHLLMCRRRAQHDKLMGALKELVYPEESEHDDSSSTSSSSSAIVRRTSKRKGPTKAVCCCASSCFCLVRSADIETHQQQILEAAVNLIKELRRAAPTQSISVPFELLPKPGARDLALGGAASIGGPLAECPIAEQRRVGVDIFRSVLFYLSACSICPCPVYVWFDWVLTHAVCCGADML